jgi:hypothetical protein
MGYFDSEKNVQDYVDIADGFDGRELVERERYTEIETDDSLYVVLRKRQ